VTKTQLLLLVVASERVVLEEVLVRLAGDHADVVAQLLLLEELLGQILEVALRERNERSDGHGVGLSVTLDLDELTLPRVYERERVRR
jgi:hypothetical protein